MKRPDLAYSYFVPVWALSTYRALVAMYVIAVAWYEWAIDEHWNMGDYFHYFTNINYSLLIIYFTTVALLVPVRRWIFKDPTYWEQDIVLNPVEKVIWFLLEIIAPAAFFLDIVYWVFLFSGTDLFYTITAHAMNSLFLIVELILDRSEFVWIHGSFVVVFGILYMFFMWIYYAAYGVWIYAFLDWYDTLAPVYYIFLPCFGLFLFVCSKGLILLRDKLAKRHGTYKKTSDDNVEMEGLHSAA